MPDHLNVSVLEPTVELLALCCLLVTSRGHAELGYLSICMSLCINGTKRRQLTCVSLLYLRSSTFSSLTLDSKVAIAREREGRERRRMRCQLFAAIVCFLKANLAGRWHAPLIVPGSDTAPPIPGSLLGQPLHHLEIAIVISAWHAYGNHEIYIQERDLL